MRFASTPVPSAGNVELTANCTALERAVGGGARFDTADAGPPATNKVSYIIASYPRQGAGEGTNGDAATSWFAAGHTDLPAPPIRFTVYVLCVEVR